jgi:hypothetical protein
MSAERVDVHIRTLEIEVDPPPVFVDQTYDLLAELVAARRRSPWARFSGAVIGRMPPALSAVPRALVVVALLALLLYVLALAAARPEPRPLRPSLLFTTYGGSQETSALLRVGDLSSPVPATVPGVTFRRPTQSPDGRYFAYWSDRRGVLEVVDPTDGSVVTYRTKARVTVGSWGPVSLDWAADTSRLALQFDAHEGGCDTEVADAGVWQFRQVTDRCLGAVRLSPDGQLLAFDHFDGTDASQPSTLIDLRTDAATTFTGHPIGWAPGGHRLLVERSTGFDILDADTGVAQPLTDPCPGGSHQMTDSAGTLLCYDTGGRLWLLPTDGRAPRPLAERPMGAVLSPDGSRVLYPVPASNTSFELWTVATDGTDRRRVVADSAGLGAWSPDGMLIAFARASLSDAQAQDVFLIAPDGTGERLVASNVAWFGWSTR